MSNQKKSGSPSRNSWISRLCMTAIAIGLLGFASFLISFLLALQISPSLSRTYFAAETDSPVVHGIYRVARDIELDSLQGRLNILWSVLAFLLTSAVIVAFSTLLKSKEPETLLRGKSVYLQSILLPSFVFFFGYGIFGLFTDDHGFRDAQTASYISFLPSAIASLKISALVLPFFLVIRGIIKSA